MPSRWRKYAFAAALLALSTSRMREFRKLSTVMESVTSLDELYDPFAQMIASQAPSYAWRQREEPSFPDTVCGRFRRRARPHAELSSSFRWWEGVRDAIADVSVGVGDSADSEVAFRTWIERALLPFYTTERMRRSYGNPLDPEAMKRILKVLDDFDSTGEPLHIYVLGGTGAWGLGSCANPTADADRTKGKEMAHRCSWAGRLEFIMNRLLERMYEPDVAAARATSKFDYEQYIKHVTKRVVVSNLAVPGRSSDTGALSLKYRLFNDDSVDPAKNPPHVVLLSYSDSDSRDDALRRETNMQEITEAARSLRPCHDVLPVVGYVNNFFLFKPDVPNDALKAGHDFGGDLYAHASWNRMWYVDYAAMVRHTVNLNPDLAGDTAATSVDPLAGTPVNLHFGAGAHMAIAWTIVHHLVQTGIDACADESFREERDSSENVELLGTIPEANENITQRVLKQYDFGGQPVEPIAKYLGRIRDDIHPWHVRYDYERNVQRKKVKCMNPKTMSTGPICSYAWMVPLAGVEWPKDINEVMNPTLTEVTGWKAAGNKDKYPRTGWYAWKKDASFTIRVTNTTVDTKFLTVVAMKSNATKYVGSTLNVDVSIVPASGTEVTKMNSFLVEGFHNETISAHSHHIFKLSGNGAKKGDTVVVSAKLKSGVAFKIAGLALCAT